MKSAYDGDTVTGRAAGRRPGRLGSPASWPPGRSGGGRPEHEAGTAEG
ncbi:MULTISPECIES: hypothetical protein [unclassified Nonomuraea]|nr:MULTISPECIES: hypothetical protein [unclassified Nonomuraea]NBE99072.1 hypothetical protein [Nonomuraea sp. K271]